MILADPENPKGIVWIASYPKSGNTWLRVFFYHLLRLQGGHPREDNEINKLDRASTYEGRLYSIFQEFLGKPLDKATRAEVAAVRPQVHAVIADRSEAVALVKTHNVMGTLNGVPTVNMAVSAGTVYVVRDPRDVALSLRSHLGTSLDAAIAVMGTRGYKNENTSETAFEVWGSWSEHAWSWTREPHEAVIVIRYEDLLIDPITHFTAIAQHVRLGVTPEQIAEAVELSTFDELRAQEEKHDFRERSERAYRFFREGRAGEWRDKLSEAQVQRITDDHYEQMRRFGYLTDA